MKQYLFECINNSGELFGDKRLYSLVVCHLYIGIFSAKTNSSGNLYTRWTYADSILEVAFTVELELLMALSECP